MAFSDSEIRRRIRAIKRVADAGFRLPTYGELRASTWTTYRARVRFPWPAPSS